MSDITPNFAGEMQLAGWTDSHTAGCKVTFWLQSTEDLEAFRALTVRKGNQSGHRFMAVLVEVGDDEMPVPPPVPEKPKGGPLSIEAASMCRNPEYLLWRSHHDEADAAAEMKKTLGIKTRAEIDHSEELKERFIRNFRGPFMKHMLARGNSNH